MKKAFQGFNSFSKQLFSVAATLFFSYTVSAQQPGSLDLSFDPGTGTNGQVNAILIQSDGKMVVGGGFSAYDTTINQNGVTRVNPNGSIDVNFNPSGKGAAGIVKALGIQSDGKIIVAGNFLMYNDSTRKRIARINADGSLDTTFTSKIGANAEISAVAIQSDGKIIIGGSFTKYDTFSRNYITRLNTDGTVDTTFNIVGADGPVKALLIQPDGKVLMGGAFSIYAGIVSRGIARFDTTGIFDFTFNAGNGVDGTVSAIALQANGKIILGGTFVSVNDSLRKNIARINSNGSFDASFNPGLSVNNSVTSVAVDANGKILAGGLFLMYNTSSNKYLVRINSDGTVDNSFNTANGAGSAINAIALQPDGRVMVGGSFPAYGGVVRGGIARLFGGLVNSLVNNNYSQSLKIYPNPFVSELTLEIPKVAKSVNVALYDLSGRAVLNNTYLPNADGKIILNEDLPQGIYLLQVVSEEFRYQSKVIKQ